MTQRQDSEDGLELTEKLVLTRTRAPDLESVKKLNCWASNISDVSVVRKLPNLEVCSLSINRITTLRDFAHCYRLKELYVRTNKISCLGDIHYLKNLTRLRYLWLSENPCADTDNYRMTVLRTLPRLQKLDNTAVTYEEVQEALSTLDEISIPNDFSASSVFNQPLNISSVSSVSSVSLDGVLSPRSSNTDLSPRDGLPMVRKKREKRRQMKAEEDTARRSAEEEFVRTSLERKKFESVRKKEGKDGDEEDDDNNDDDDDADNSGESVSDDVKASTDSESSGSSSNNKVDTNKSEMVNGGGGLGEVCIGGRGDNGCSDDDGVGDDIDDESIKSVDYSNDNKDDNNKNNTDEREVILENNNDKYKSNCNNNNDNKDDDGCENEVEESQSGGVFKGGNCGIKDVDHGTTDCLLDKIRLDDSLAIDDDNEDQRNPSHDSIELDDLVVEVSEDNHTLTNYEVGSDIGPEVEKGDDSIEKKIDDVEKGDDSDFKSVENSDVICSENDSNYTAQSSPKSRSDLDNKTVVSPQKTSVDWDHYNRMRQDVGMRPIEKGPGTYRPLTADVTRLRNGNILQAVLSLVKELDKDSLELVASAVKVRIDGL